MHPIFRSRPAVMFLLAVAALVAAPTSARAVDLREKIDSLAKPLIADSSAAGFVVGVLQDGKPLVLGYGETVKGSAAVPDGDTLFEIGSITKLFTCSLLADMVERGLMKLDDPVQQYLPDGVKMPVAEDQPIKLVDLATHTSGLPRMPDNLKPADFANPYAEYDDERLYAFLNGHKQRRPPGKYEYSNLGMGLLGEIMAKRAGTSYEQLLRDRITGPLAMNDTQIRLDEAHQKRFAQGHNEVMEPIRAWDFQAMAAAGGIRSTAQDMLKFAAANLKTDDAPLTQAFRLAQTKQRDSEGGKTIGLGWNIAADGTRSHSGATAGYHAMLAILPDKQLGVVVLANRETGRFSQLGQLILRAAQGEDVQPLSPQKPIPVRKEVTVDPATLARYAGQYRLSDGTEVTIALADGKLTIEAPTTSKVPMFAESPTEFFFKAVDGQITFVPEPDGSVKKFIVQNHGSKIEAQRLK